jgi:acylphosphatase
MSRAVDVRVTGLVQGVSFRALAREQARRLGVTGWLRNQPDGSVAGHFEGADDAVERLVAWCGHGPAHATVDRVEVSDVSRTGATAFEIR